jgi:dihydroxyacetone kinase phosphoprotein-dependent L subunit
MTGEIDAKEIVLNIISIVEDKKGWLSEIDGAIGDGDHGINMAKGFAMVKSEIDDKPNELSALFHFIGMTLLTRIGGAMGPIYGTLFMKMAKAIRGKQSLEKEDILNMLSLGLEGVQERGGAEVGDKTLVDTLYAAKSGYKSALDQNRGMKAAIDELINSARRGMNGTEELVAKKGRSSRLGERSRGTIDAGAASCFIILEAMGESLKKYL